MHDSHERGVFRRSVAPVAIFRVLSVAAALGATALLAFEPASGQQHGIVHNGEAGFVVSDIAFAFSNGTSEETGACPDGLSRGSVEAYTAAHPQDAVQRPDEADRAYALRMRQAASQLPDGTDICLNPAAAEADPGFREVTGTDTRALGFDLDGVTSRANQAAPRGACAHTDFRGVGGQAGIDNQFFRTVGCVRAYEPTGVFNDFGDEMLGGNWGILIALRGVDDLRNDREVEVLLLRNADPLQLGPSREVLPFMTYAPMQEETPRAAVRGRIVNGVLTSDPFDFTFDQSVSMYDLRTKAVLRDARIQLTISDDGSAEGYLGGFMPVESLYANMFSFTAATGAGGAPPEERLAATVRNGGPFFFGFTCNGIYDALLRNADGHPDPATGRCTSISIQYSIRAMPAFITDAAP